MKLNGSLRIISDKSITHRAIMLSSMAKGKTVLHYPLVAEDTRATQKIFEYLGVLFEFSNKKLTILSEGMESFKVSDIALDAQNSGTTARLIMGALAGLPINYLLTGDGSLSNRPMTRIKIPLEAMGLTMTLSENGTLPANIKGNKSLKGITYDLPVASAQLKSAILFAGLHTTETTTIVEKNKSRNHTELMFETFNVQLTCENQKITLKGQQVLISPKNIYIPGDISQAAYFMVASLLVPNSSIKLTEVGINPTRTGILDVLTAMGATIEQKNKKWFGKEPVADLIIRYTNDLQGVTVFPEAIPRLIDEIPILALLAATARGTTIFFGVDELKVKETDRLSKLIELITQIGGIAKTDGKNLEIIGQPGLIFMSNDETLDTASDHRMVMMLLIAELRSRKKFNLTNLESLNVSYPNFQKDLQSLITSL